MPIHDWSRVDACIFHSFRVCWISELMGALNLGLLPADYYALAEQVAETPPHIRPDLPRRHIAIRHITGHRIVALIEVVSPANKDRNYHVRELAEKVERSLGSGIHVLLLDLLSAGPHDPRGLHGAVWAYFDTAPYEPPTDAPLTLASYAWDDVEPQAYIEPVAVGSPLIDMPLFLTADRYVNVPLESTYLAAYRGMPQFWRDVLERGSPPAESS